MFVKKFLRHRKNFRPGRQSAPPGLCRAGRFLPRYRSIFQKQTL